MKKKPIRKTKEKWSKIPPTKEEINKSYNGFFWIRTLLWKGEKGPDKKFWPPVFLIEPVQVFWLFEPKKKREKGLGLDRALVRLRYSKKDLFLDNKKHMKGLEWQIIVPPEGVNKNNC